LASNHLLHETVQFQASDCQPPFAQKRVDSSLITQIESNLVLQIAQFSKLPAGLRMNAMANPGVDKADFELFSLAVSALNGCGMCIDSHVQTLLKHEVSAQAIQSSIKLAAVLNAALTARKLS